MAKKKNYWLIIIATSVLIVGLMLWKVAVDDPTEPNQQDNIQSISNYEECKTAGYPIVESFPEQCGIPGGETFSRELTDVNSTEPIIQQGWKVFEDDLFSFAYPETWSLDDQGTSDITDGHRTIVLSSPDLKTEPQENGKDFVVAGATVRLSVNLSDGKTLDELESSLSKMLREESPDYYFTPIDIAETTGELATLDYEGDSGVSISFILDDILYIVGNLDAVEPDIDQNEYQLLKQILESFVVNG